MTITDQAAAAGISGTNDWSFGAAAADFTGDGWPDLFISHHSHPANLYLNNQDGTFTPADVSFFSSILDRHDCQVADFNQDRQLDIFCSVGADRGTSLKCNGLFLQQPDGSFADMAYQWNIGDAAGRGRFCAVLDANNDGYPDIFYGTDPVRVDGLPSINRFYLNTGQGSFIDSPAMGLNLNVGAQSARTVDYNGNGWPDLLICGYTGGLRLFENNQGQGFTDVSSILGPSINAVDAVMVDVNHDNLLDLIVLTKTAVKLIRQNANGTWAKPKTILNVSSGVALAVGDVNGDNNPDIYVVCGKTGGANAPDYLVTFNATGGSTTMAVPQTTTGSGERAFPIDYNNSGLTSFLVLNGAVPSTGPIQLLTPAPTDGAGDAGADWLGRSGGRAAVVQGAKELGDRGGDLRRGAARQVMTGPVQHHDAGVGQGGGEPLGGPDRDDHVVRIGDQQDRLRHGRQRRGEAAKLADQHALLDEEAAPQRPMIVTCAGPDLPVHGLIRAQRPTVHPARRGQYRAGEPGGQPPRPQRESSPLTGAASTQSAQVRQPGPTLASNTRASTRSGASRAVASATPPP